MRFALKSRRGLHFPIASDAPKYLRKEIERRLDVVKDIRHDPQLLPADFVIPSDASLCKEMLPHIFRMKAVDSLAQVEQEIVRSSDERKRRPAGQDVRFYLQRQVRDTNGPLYGVDSSLINAFIDSYYHARHDSKPFAFEEYQKHVKLLNELLEYMRKKSGRDGDRDSRLPPAAQTDRTDGTDGLKDSSLNKRSIFVFNTSSNSARVTLSPNGKRDCNSTDTPL